MLLQADSGEVFCSLLMLKLRCWGLVWLAKMERLTARTARIHHLKCSHFDLHSLLSFTCFFSVLSPSLSLRQLLTHLSFIHQTLHQQLNRQYLRLLALLVSHQPPGHSAQSNSPPPLKTDQLTSETQFFRSLYRALFQALRGIFK